MFFQVLNIDHIHVAVLSFWQLSSFKVFVVVCRATISIELKAKEEIQPESQENGSSDGDNLCPS